MRAVILRVFGVSAWLGPLVNRPGFAILCLLSKQMFGVCLFLAVYFFSLKSSFLSSSRGPI